MADLPRADEEAGVERHFVARRSPIRPRNPAGFHPCQGLYHVPAGRRPAVAFVATHYNVDFSEHYLGPYMARRGYGFLGWNTSFRGNEAYFILDHALVEIGVGVRWLREEAGVETVVLLGNSGGGSLMAAYQSQATEPNVTPVGGMKPAPGIDRLIPGDLFVSLAAHTGRPEVLTSWLDPSVTDELDPLSRDPSLDMYDPANAPPYSPDFVARYRAAQRDRNERITDWVLAEIGRLRGAGHYERLFPLYRTWADLRLLDGTIDPSDREVGRCYLGDPARFNYTPFGIGAFNTLRTWLSMWSLRTSQCVGAPHFARIRAPSIVIQPTADTGVFPSDARSIHEHLAADDKELHLTAGDHYYQSPEGIRDEIADLVAGWLRARGA